MPVCMLNGSDSYSESLIVEVWFFKKLSIQLTSSEGMQHLFRLCRSL